jgi:phosphatidylglycerophosphatase A
MTNPPKRTRWAWLLGTWFGTGFLKPGPGTWGSLTAALLWVILCSFLPSPHYGIALANSTSTISATTLVGILTAIASLATLIIGIPASTIVARESNSPDPQHVVIDEVCGQWIALLFMPPTWQSAVLCLALFRIFDIIKPPPARQLERLHGGAGVMLDDVAAGIYALVVAQALQHWFRIAGHA